MPRFEPLNTQELVSSPFSKQCFHNVGCLGFYEQIHQVGYHAKLTNLFATNLIGYKIKIAEVEFIISSETITIATRIPKQWGKVVQKLRFGHFKLQGFHQNSL